MVNWTYCFSWQCFTSYPERIIKPNDLLAAIGYLYYQTIKRIKDLNVCIHLRYKFIFMINAAQARRESSSASCSLQGNPQD